MSGSPQSDDSVVSNSQDIFPGATPLSDESSSTSLAEHELDAALQLLVERAQYITGATGTALALPQDNEMVCRASAGACAPAVGARLQVRSGLTGESIARRQLLRCDNAETDPRVNLETCRALGIASIVVLPLMRRNGEVRGLFELFSDHPYAFEERDLVALERMAALTMTALDLAEQGQDLSASVRPTTKPDKQATAAMAAFPKEKTDNPQPAIEAVPNPAAESIATTEVVEQPPVPSAAPVAMAQVAEPAALESPAVPEAMLRVQKCVSCGFPVSEGRTLCLDCEGRERQKSEAAKRPVEQAIEKSGAVETTKTHEAITATAAEPLTSDAAGTSEAKPVDAGGTAKLDGREEADTTAPDAPPEEILPPFLVYPGLMREPWLTRHLNLLAFFVLVAAVLVAVVVFFR
jgi:putative methionine-R-sulfoxide reductase with GAF domain